MIIDIDNVKINYEIDGQGETVLVLHGWGGCIDSMRPVINHLKKSFRVVSLDFPGHGKSDFPDSVWGVPEYTENLIKFLKSIGVEMTNIIAHSFGGRVTILLASQNPEMVEKIVLVDSGGLIKKRTLKYYSKVYTFKFIKNFLKLFLSGTKLYDNTMEKARKKFGSSEYKELPPNMRACFSKIVNQDLKPYLKEIKSSTLLVWGENDQDTPVYMGKIMEQEIKDSGLVVFKGAGHFSYLDNGNQFNRVIDSFLGVK